MAYTSETVKIEGTKVKIATGTYGGGTEGKSQTVNVFDDSNTEGDYREVYRFREPEMFVTATQVSQAASTLDDLDRYLLALGALKEGPRRR